MDEHGRCYTRRLACLEMVRRNPLVETRSREMSGDSRRTAADGLPNRHRTVNGGFEVASRFGVSQCVPQRLIKILDSGSSEQQCPRTAITVLGLRSDVHVQSSTTLARLSAPFDTGLVEPDRCSA
jgi:hypothetical protein